jgi:hypothetical protein
MNKTTYVKSASSTAFSATRGELTPASAPSVAVRHHSSHTASLGVYVEGAVKVQRGQASSMSLSLDPVALDRKLAVQQVQMELQGSPFSQTTNRRR